MVTIGRRMRSARVACGLTQVEVAQRAGLAQTTVSQAERDGATSMTALHRLAAVLGLELTLVPASASEEASA